MVLVAMFKMMRLSGDGGGGGFCGDSCDVDTTGNSGGHKYW